MEIKIKNNGDLIDATIEMVDGIMIVSQKEIKEVVDISKFNPGDIVVCGWNKDGMSYYWICILRGIEKMIDNYYIEDFCGLDLETNLCWYQQRFSDSATEIRHATEEEIKLFFDKLKEGGFEWSMQRRKLNRIKWIPNKGEKYFATKFKGDKFYPAELIRTGATYDEDYFNWGIFKTEKECSEFCQRLNQVIEGVKP